MTAIDRLIANSNSIIATLRAFSDSEAQDVTFTWINDDDTTTDVTYDNIVKFQTKLNDEFQELNDANDSRFERINYIRRMEASATLSGATSFNEDKYLKWDDRIIMMGIGSDSSTYTTHGYINLRVPAKDTTIPALGNADDITVTDDGIPISRWGTLFYKLADNYDDVDSNDDSWVFVGYNDDTGIIPSNWIVVATFNDDVDSVKIAGHTIPKGRTVYPDGFANPINKSYIQTYTEDRSFDDGDATVLKKFDEVTIQKGKDVELNIYVPTRSDAGDDWGGLYINTNICVNGDWYNLGNGGYDGGAMFDDASVIHNFTQTKILKLCENLNLTDEYTFQVELTCRSYNSTTYVNKDHDINRTANKLDSRGDLVDWAKNMNYTTITIKEVDA